MGGGAVWCAAARGMPTLSSHLRHDNCRCCRVAHSGQHAGTQLWLCSQLTHLSGCMHATKGFLPALASCAPCCRCRPWRRCWPSSQTVGWPLLAKPLPAVTAPPPGCQIPVRAQHRPPSAWGWRAQLAAPAATAPVPGCCSRPLSHMQPLPRTPAQCLRRQLRWAQHRHGPGPLRLAAELGGLGTGLSCRWHCATQWRPCWRQPGCASPPASGAVQAPAGVQPTTLRQPPGGQSTPVAAQHQQKRLPRQVQQRQADVTSCTATSVPANPRSEGAVFLRLPSSLPCRLRV